MSRHTNRQNRVRRPRPRKPDHPLSDCTICGAPCYPAFFVDIHGDMSCKAHPDCVMCTSPWVFGEDKPPKPIEKGQRVFHTCGNPMCIAYDHLEVVG